MACPRARTRSCGVSSAQGMGRGNGGTGAGRGGASARLVCPPCATQPPAHPAAALPPPAGGEVGRRRTAARQRLPRRRLGCVWVNNDRVHNSSSLTSLYFDVATECECGAWQTRERGLGLGALARPRSPFPERARPKGDARRRAFRGAARVIPRPSPRARAGEESQRRSAVRSDGPRARAGARARARAGVLRSCAGDAPRSARHRQSPPALCEELRALVRITHRSASRSVTRQVRSRTRTRHRTQRA